MPPEVLTAPAEPSATADPQRGPIAAPPSVPGTPPATRLASLDAYRGFVMFLMMAGSTMSFVSVSRALPANPFWSFLAFHQTHSQWLGCSLHDLIQPSFSFIVGVALPFSIASRLGRGQTMGKLTLHAAWRSLLLIALGVFLRSVGRPQTFFTFTDTPAQIGFGYTFLFLLGFRSVRTQWIAFGLLLIGDWLLFALYPTPGPAFDYATVGVTPEWFAQHGLHGFASHWNMNSNAAAAFDVWFLNLFPQQPRFAFNPGATCTLNFIPTLATMILGLVTGETLRSARSPQHKLPWLALAGLITLIAGWGLGALGFCPVVKKLWTPSWVLFSGGWCSALDGGVLPRARSLEIPPLVLSFDRHRNEFHRRLLPRAPERWLHPLFPAHPSRQSALPHLRQTVRDLPPRHVLLARALADPVLDVPPEDLPANLILGNRSSFQVLVRMERPEASPITP